MRDRDRDWRRAGILRGVAAGVLDGLADPAHPDVARDRGDLARLMSMIAEAWESALIVKNESPVVAPDESGFLTEQLAWSRVIAFAERSAQRIQAEAEQRRGSPTIRQLHSNSRP